jgi:diadenosine tetraphosphate (Ap4A) HIT family hydrolase
MLGFWKLSNWIRPRLGRPSRAYIADQHDRRHTLEQVFYIVGLFRINLEIKPIRPIHSLLFWKIPSLSLSNIAEPAQSSVDPADRG